MVMEGQHNPHAAKIVRPEKRDLAKIVPGLSIEHMERPAILVSFLDSFCQSRAPEI